MAETIEELEKQSKDTNLHPELREHARQKFLARTAKKEAAAKDDKPTNE